MAHDFKTVPILRSFDEARAKAFYLDFLGFQVDWEHRFEPGAPLYMQISLEDLRLHLSEHHGDGTPGSAVFVQMTGLEDFHRRISARDYPNMRPGIEAAPWGGRMMMVIDPFASRLTFWEPGPGEG